MTREQVIKGLECCKDSLLECECPEDCPYVSKCSSDGLRAMLTDVYALIREQQEEIQRLCDALKPEPPKEADA